MVLKTFASKLSVYPNPALRVVNVSSPDNALVNAVYLADMNGRIVKTAKFYGVAAAKVNV